jgi:hypothetical protein
MWSEITEGNRTAADAHVQMAQRGISQSAVRARASKRVVVCGRIGSIDGKNCHLSTRTAACLQSHPGQRQLLTTLIG